MGVLPVVQQSFHEARDRRDEGDARLPPGLLLDLLQQARHKRYTYTSFFKGTSWAEGKKQACNGRSFLVASDWLNRVSFLLPGVRPKQLSSNNPAAQGKSETLRL